MLCAFTLFSFINSRLASSSTQLDYVAFGDSLAAGVTPDNTIDKGYAAFISEKLGEEGVLGSYSNYGMPGYKTADIINIINPSIEQNAEVVSSIKNAEIITLDIGANDLLGSASALAANPTQALSIIQGVAKNIYQIVCTFKSINPNAKIYLMGYYNAFLYYPAKQQEGLIPLIQGFNLATKGVATLTGARYVDTYSTMNKHLATYLPKDNIHPNLSGYRAIAKDFWDNIKNDFLKGRE